MQGSRSAVRIHEGVVRRLARELWIDAGAEGVAGFDRAATKVGPGFLCMLMTAMSCMGCAGPTERLPKLPPPTSVEYRLGPGDKLRIITFGEPSLTGEFQVSDIGELALPLVSHVRAAGMTSLELELAIDQRLQSAGIMNDVKVSAEVVTYRPVFVLGEVRTAGQLHPINRE